MSEQNSNNQKPKTSTPPRPRGGPMGRGGPMAMIPGEKARDFKGTMSRLISYLGKYRIAILFTLLMAAVATAFSIVGPKILGTATTTLYEGILARISGAGDIDFIAIRNILLRVLALYLISAMFRLMQGWIMSGISIDITYRLRKDIASKINLLPLKYFDQVTQGEVLSRVTNDVDTISQTLNQSLSQIVTSTTHPVRKDKIRRERNSHEKRICTGNRQL